MNEANLADKTLVATFLSYLAARLIEATPVLQALALVATIVAATVATCYHLISIYHKIRSTDDES